MRPTLADRDIEPRYQLNHQLQKIDRLYVFKIKPSPKGVGLKNGKFAYD